VSFNVRNQGQAAHHYYEQTVPFSPATKLNYRKELITCQYKLNSVNGRSQIVVSREAKHPTRTPMLDVPRQMAFT
jgi:hypothetical protein